MTKTTKIIIGIVIVGLAIWIIVALRNPNETASVSEPIKIGVIAPLSGPVADYGEEIRQGVLAATGTSTVQLLFEDDKCDPKEAVSTFQKLTEFNKIKFIIGPACGSPQEAIVPLLKDKNVLTIVPAAASSALYQLSGNNFYNIQYSLEDESKFIAEQMFARGYDKVALVSYGNAFSKTHADSFRVNFKGGIALDEVINDDNANVSTVITKIKVAGVKAIYAPDVSWFFASAIPKLIQQKVVVPVFGTYVVELPAVRDLVPDVFYSFPGDLTGPEGAVYGLAKQAAEVLIANVSACVGDYACVKNKLQTSGQFNQQGIFERPFILKQIKDGQPVIIND